MAERRAHILGTGRHLPARVVTNADIAARVATTDEWIKKHLGIVERRFAADDEQTSDLAAQAARRARPAPPPPPPPPPPRPPAPRGPPRRRPAGAASCRRACAPTGAARTWW